MSAIRANLHYEVIPAANEPQKRAHLVRLLYEVDGGGVVYASTVRQVDVLYDLLHRLGFDVARYHGRIAPRQLKDNQERFLSGAVHTMIATSAFGAGIDKSDIRFVIHYNLPESLSSYRDQSARAGQDGKASRCVLFYPVSDRGDALSPRQPPDADVLAVYSAMQTLTTGDEAVSLGDIKRFAGALSRMGLRDVVTLLKDLGVLKEERGALVRLLLRGASSEQMAWLLEQHRLRHASDRAEFNRVAGYVRTTTCRWLSLLEGLDVPAAQEPCGTCDNCRHPLEQQVGPPGEHAEAADNG